MTRFLISVLVWVTSSAVGLLVAQGVLGDMTVDALSFVFVAVLFAAVQALLAPFLTKMTTRYAPALVGGVGLFTTFLALVVTATVSDGLRIRGFDTWVYASLIIWLVTMLATLLLPLIARHLVRRRRLRNASASVSGSSR